MLVIGKTIMSHLACLSLCFGYRQYLDRDITNIICKLCQKFRSVCSGFLTSWFVNFWDKLRENSLHSRTKVKLLNQSLCHGNLEKATRVLKIGSQRGEFQDVPKASTAQWLFKNKLSFSNAIPTNMKRENVKTYQFVEKCFIYLLFWGKILNKGIQQTPDIWNLLQSFGFTLYPK